MTDEETIEALRRELELATEALAALPLHKDENGWYLLMSGGRYRPVWAAEVGETREALL